MAESTRARKSRAAKQAAASAEGQAMAREVRYATRKTLGASQGPPVVAIDLPVAELRILARRPNLLQLLEAGSLPEPITGMVRQLMLFGVQSVETDYSRAQYESMALGLMRAVAIVPPPALLNDEITVNDITPDMCQPLFVAPGETPGDDQMVLVGPLDPDVWGDDVCRVSQVDITSFLWQIMVSRVGAARHFRSPGTEQAGAVATGGPVEGDGGDGAPVEAAAA